MPAVPPTQSRSSSVHSIPQSLRGWLQTFRELSKSGIVALVLISVLGGYLIGQPFEIPVSWGRLAVTLLGILFLASGSSALNQLQERHIDAQMPRTAKRPLPSGRLTPGFVLGFVILSILAGLTLLAQLQASVLLLGVFAVISYNGLYTLWWKKHWAYAAVPGAIPGALPILMGHIAANGDPWNPGGIYLFFILFFWQMPHFWVLALKFEKDYRQGGFPTLPVARGARVTVALISLWCVCYVALALAAPLFLHVKWIYWAVTSTVSLKLLVELRRWSKSADPAGAWLKFFLWVNFSLILYIGAAAADLWSVYLPWNH